MQVANASPSASQDGSSPVLPASSAAPETGSAASAAAAPEASTGTTAGSAAPAVASITAPSSSAAPHASARVVEERPPPGLAQGDLPTTSLTVLALGGSLVLLSGAYLGFRLLRAWRAWRNGQ